MKAKTNLARHLLAQLKTFMRRVRLTNLNAVLAGFGVPVCGGAVRRAGRLSAITFASLALAGCMTPPPLKGRADLLGFLADGKTTRTEVFTTLGQPSGRFEAEKILTYRLGHDGRNDGYYVVEREPTSGGWPTWTMAQFSLVLVFDADGILQKHNLVQVNQ
jgi:hypothetical protein